MGMGFNEDEQGVLIESAEITNDFINKLLIINKENELQEVGTTTILVISALMALLNEGYHIAVQANHIDKNGEKSSTHSLVITDNNETRKVVHVLAKEFKLPEFFNIDGGNSELANVVANLLTDYVFKTDRLATESIKHIVESLELFTKGGKQ